ncbi:MAG: manganese-binding transcriptional regulator MntR [Alphaproteobacteria bacterium]|jgi:DtxR family manganese transport transcriptional regulator
MKPADQQAQAFQRVRDAHASEIVEDYVELIGDLTEVDGAARAVDLARRFGVTPATVNATLKRLERDGFVTSAPYRAVFLTEKGRMLADRCRARHAVVRDFLVALGVDPVTADADAEGIEHHVSKQTLEAFRRFVASQNS